MVKGGAILGVTLIHSQALGDSAWMRLLVYHSVPVLIVVFGMNAEQWFRGRPAPGRVATWYRRALKRIALPVWSALFAWWAMVLLLHPPLLTPTVRLAILHALGIPQYVGTGWFIAVLVQLVAAFPALRWCVRRFGARPVFAVALLVTVGLMLAESDLRAALGRAGWTYLSPRFAAHVVFGMILANLGGTIDRRSGILAVAGLILLDVLAEAAPLGQPWGRIASRLSELPLAVALLGAAAALAHVKVLAGGLGWLGRHSLGLYLGQLLTHNFFLFTLGGSCSVYGCRGGVYEQIDPWVYTGILLLGSALWTAVGNEILARVAALRARGVPLPDLST
jgi:peptidoglycan/LPS O-acetylase OafA/YrhL